MAQSGGFLPDDKSAETRFLVPVNRTNMDDICTAWAQEQYGSKFKVHVDTSDLKVIEGNIDYTKKDKKEKQSIKRSAKTYVNRLDIPAEQEFSEQSTKKYTCVWTQTKGLQVSGGLSVNVRLPAVVGLSTKVEGQLSLSETKTTTSGADDTSSQVTRLQQPPRSTLLAEIITKESVITMPYSLHFRLQGNISFTLEKDSGKSKVKSVNVAELYRAFGGKAVTDGEGKKSVMLTTEGTFETSIEVHQVVEMKEPDAEKVMKMVHNDLLNDNREKIVEEVSDGQALSRLLQAMSSENAISEQQYNSISQRSSVQERVNELVDVLIDVEPDIFLLFVDILQRDMYSELVELLNPRSIYPYNVRHISNLNGVVDDYFVTKKERKIRNSLESARGAILHGMPGSGKTQLAYKVAGDYARFHPHSVVWVIEGSSEEKLHDEMANLQQRLSGEANDDNSLFQSLVSRWTHFLFLINDLSPTVAIPTQLLNSSAKIIVTTQDSLVELEDFENIPIEGFTEDEAVAFLSIQMPPGTSTEQMKDLANIFSCLPLGLAAARASIHRGNMTVEEYKRQLHGGREALSSLKSREDRWLQKHYKRDQREAASNIFAALQLAIDKLDDPCNSGEETKCKAMLQPCAFLDPNNIPILILKCALQCSPTIGSDAHFTERMRMYSLGSIEGEGVKRRLSIHGVTQMAIRLHMDKEQQTACLNRLMQILVKFFSKDTMYADMYKFSVSLMPHVEAALKHADKLELGSEYPLMKARLLMVYGRLLGQNGKLALSEEPLNEAKKLLLEFADINVDNLCASDQDPEYDTFTERVLNELYKPLADKSQSLDNSVFHETVIHRVITKQHLGAVRDKLSKEDRLTLENMVENFEPLTTEMYTKLVDSNMAIPEETLKRIFLPELYISIVNTLVKASIPTMWFTFPPLSDCRTPLKTDLLIALNMCSKLKTETGFTMLSSLLALYESMEITLLVGDLDDTKPIGKATNMLKESENESSIWYYDFGLLISGEGDIFNKLNTYENTMKLYHRVACARKIRSTHHISEGKMRCKAMLELVESESRTGNPPQELAAYYLLAGRFLIEAGIFEMMQEGKTELFAEAVEIFWKAYRVELKRKEYHPRMEEALMGLTVVHVIQNEPRKALVCARRLIQLSQDHWKNNSTVLPAESMATLLPRVYKKVAFQALQQNKEEKYNRAKVTTV